MSRYCKTYKKVMALQRRKTPMPWTPAFLEFTREPSIPFPLKERLQPPSIDLSYYLNMEVGDLVEVLHGSDTGRQGVVLSIDRKKNTVVVDGCNMKKSFWNPREGASIVTQERPIHITNVALLDPVVKRPTRVKRRFMMNGESVRISKLSGSAMPEPPPSPSPAALQQPNLLKQAIKQKLLGPPLKDAYKEADPLNLRILRRLARQVKWGNDAVFPSPHPSPPSSSEGKKAAEHFFSHRGEE